MSDIDSVPQVSSEMRRAKLCALCARPIAVYDKSAGCQDPNLSYPECDRLPVPDEGSAPVEEVSASNPDAPSTSDTVEPTPIPTSEPEPVVLAADPLADQTEYQPPPTESGMAQS